MGQEQILVNKPRMREITAAVLNHRSGQNELFQTESEPPEKRFIELLKQKTPEAFFLNALFLTTTMVFGDSTYRMFGRITKPQLFDCYEWIFRPEKVLEEADNGVEVEAKVAEFFRPGGYSRNAIAQWVHNCRVLKEKYGNDIRNFFAENGNDAVRVVEALVVRPRAKTREKDGLRRAGPKIARLYMQWVGQYGSCELINIDQFGLPVDFQLGRLAIQGGGVELTSPTNSDLLTRRILLPLLMEICEEDEITPRILSEKMWLVGSRRCNKRLHTECPIEDLCTRMISRKPYDKDGLFDPKDVGRYT